MNSEPYTLHVAIFPSLQAINICGGGDMLVNAIRGNYSKNVHTRSVYHGSKFVIGMMNKFVEVAMISWKAQNDKDGKPVTVRQILESLQKDKIPDIAIQEITFVIPYVAYDKYTMQNQTFWLTWTFHPHTFRKGIWKRLKAEHFPSKELYIRYLDIKRTLRENLDKETYKRWRDVLLINAPHPELDNDDVKSIWMGRPFALLLKETRGKFDLMNLGELRK